MLFLSFSVHICMQYIFSRNITNVILKKISFIAKENVESVCSMLVTYNVT